MSLRSLYAVASRLGRAFQKLEVKVISKYGLRPYQPPPFEWMSGFKPHRREDATLARWEAIKKQLPEDGFTALDIGCNIGFFCYRMRQNGARLVLGFDAHPGPILLAEKVRQLEHVDSVAFMHRSMDLELSEKLGEFDVILFLSVFHHINMRHGIEYAKSVLRNLLSRARFGLFFETGQADDGCEQAVAPKSMPTMTGPARVYVSELLQECGAAHVEYLGEMPGAFSSTRCLFLARRA